MGRPEGLDGTTLKVYRYLLMHGVAGVRELQRKMGFKSPSVAAYHLSKLEKLGLVERLPGGKYKARNEVSIRFVMDLIVVGRLAVPRLVFYAVFVTMLAVFSVALMFQSPYSSLLIAIIGCAVAAVALWVEAIKTYRL